MQGYTDPFQIRHAVPLGSCLPSAKASQVEEVNVPYVCSVGPDHDSGHHRKVGTPMHSICMLVKLITPTLAFAAHSKSTNDGQPPAPLVTLLRQQASKCCMAAVTIEWPGRGLTEVTPGLAGA